MTPRRLATSEKINLSKEFQINEQVQIQQQGPENQAQSSKQLGKNIHRQSLDQKTEGKVCAEQLVSKPTEHIDFLPYKM